MKKYYFVDFESIKKINVTPDNFDVKTYIYIFYLDAMHPKNIDLDCLQIMNQYAKKVEFIKVPDEKHLLGKYLCGTLGMLIGESKKEGDEYIILSPKTSYDSYVNYLNSLGNQVSRLDNFNEEEKKKTPKENKKETKKTVKPVQSKKTPTPKKEEKVEIKHEEKEVIQKVEATPVEPIKEEVIEVKQEEIKKEVVEEVKTAKENNSERSKYDQLYNKMRQALTANKNDNGNRYSPKTKKDITHLVTKELKVNKDLERIYRILRERYIVTYQGIYEVIRPCILEVFSEAKDYEPDLFDNALGQKYKKSTKQEDLELFDDYEDSLGFTNNIDDDTQVQYKEENEEVIKKKNIEVKQETANENDFDSINQDSIQETMTSNEQIQEESVENQQDNNDEILKILKEVVEENFIDEILQIIEDRKLPTSKSNFVYLSLSKLLGRNRAVEINRKLKPLLK